MGGSSAVLLVGGTGRVGRMLRHHWALDAKAPRLVVQSRQELPGCGDQVLWSPLAGPQGLEPQLQRLGLPDLTAMIVLAGVTPGITAAGEPADLEDNLRLAEACLAAARALGIGRVLLASSAAVYGAAADGHAFDEQAPLNPVNPYGAAKLRMERACQPWRAAGMDLCLLRIGNVAGADALLGANHRPDGLSPQIVIDRFADGGGPVRSYIAAGALTHVLVQLTCLPTALPPVLNIAAPEPVAMVALAQAAGWAPGFRPAPSSAHQRIVLDCGLLAGICPPEPRDNLPTEMVHQWKVTLPHDPNKTPV